MDIQIKLKELKDEKSYSGPAKSVKHYLSPILSQSNNLRKRWMWELLQNASDLGDNIKVRIVIEPNKLTYSHNGKNFTLSEAYNLIMPDSSKDNDVAKSKSVIGQFGTGFISTHILSKIIQISGIIEDDGQLYSFNFHLDRSIRTDKDYLIQSIKESEAEYRENLKLIAKLSDDEYQTSFTYFIDNTYASLKGQEIVSDGIESFKELIPFVFTFRPQLEEIEIVDKRNSTIQWNYKRGEEETEIDNLVIIKTICLENNIHIEDRLIGNIITNETEIAFPIERIENNKFQLLSFPEKCPRLFCAFPMIGTSEFNFPVVIHSESFVPNRERDGIEITEFDSVNRERLNEAIKCYGQLLGIVQDNNWTNAYNICRISIPDFDDVETQKWFLQDVFNPIKEGIYNSDLIELDESLGLENNRKSLSSMYIPYADKRMKGRGKVVDVIYDFAFKAIADQIPSRQHYKKWYDVLDFEIFDSEKLNIEKLCELISPNGTLSDYASGKNMTEEDVIKYFIDLVDFVIKQDEAELLNKHNLILNQSNEFAIIKGLKLDFIDHKGLKNGYNEKLKDVYFSLSEKDCRANLLHKDFERIENILDKDDNYDFRELSKDIDEELRTYEGNFQDENFLLILKDMFNWYTTCGLSEETLENYFPYFSGNKSQLYLNTKTPQELEFAFDIEISGKSEVLAKLAKSDLSEIELEVIATNPDLVSSFIDWLNNKQKDNPDKELGNIGEEFLNHQLCKIFGEERVLWENKSEYDFRILEKDLTTTKYYIDAKTTAKGIANSDNVPFFMRTAQWTFLDKQIAFDKYIIARVFKNDNVFSVKYLKLNKHPL